MSCLKNPKVITFGCRLNTFESEKIRQMLEATHVDDVIVVNTCAVTAEAERQARQMIRRLKSEHPDKRIFVTGCSATICPKMYTEMEQVDAIISNSDKNKMELFLPPSMGADSLPVFQTSPSYFLSGFEGRARAFLQIQTGCDHFCSFCVIRIARGKSKSFSTEEIFKQAEMFVERGYKEINLTGVDICSFQHDQLTLGLLVQQLLKRLPMDVRIRLSSLDPAAIDPALYEVLGDLRLLPHWHLSLQSGDDWILKKMLRRHSVKDLEKVIEKARASRPDIVFGSDIIVGFPAETDAMFQNTCDLVQDLGIALLHVFPYSDRPGTMALDYIPKIQPLIIKERTQKLTAIGQKVLSQIAAAFVGQVIPFLVEKNKDGQLSGKTDHFLPIQVQKGHASMRPGLIATAEIEEVRKTNGKVVLFGTVH